MPARSRQKIKVVAILDILRKYSDEEHPLNANIICEKLALLGITAERKSIYSDISALIDYGYDIISTRVPYSGYYLASREFELPEVYLLTDAVQAAGFITAKKTRELVKKLDGLLSENQAKKREKGMYIDNSHKCENEEIFYNIDTLSNAIAQQKTVELVYRARHIGNDRKPVYIEKKYTLNPYALVWQNDHYYLVANNPKYDNLMNIRIDRMKRVKMTEQKARHFSQVCEYKEYFDVADYAKKTFNMFSGEIAEVELKCDEKILEQVIDRFSDKIFIRNVENGTFTFSSKAFISDGLINWVLSFGTQIEVKKPNVLREKIAVKIGEMNRLYNQ